jgi:hypothetical protein
MRTIFGLKQSGFSGVIVATTRDLKNGTNTSNAMAGALMDYGDHRSELLWALVPRMIAAFFKISFSCLSKASSRRSTVQSSAAGFSPTARCPVVQKASSPHPD